MKSTASTFLLFFRNWRLVLVSLLLAACTISSMSYWWLQRWLNSPLHFTAHHSQELVLVVESGDTLSKVAHQLYTKKLLDLPGLLIFYARLTDQTQVNIGEYQLSPQTTPLALLKKLQSNDVIKYSVTLIEGKTFDDFLSTLQRQQKIRPVIRPTGHDDILIQLSLDIEHLEGWFFPDTYTYTAGVTDKTLLLRAHRRMRQILDEEWRQRQPDLPYKNPYEALIMASIVEKETGVAYERRQIAGVFVRRLQQDMRLQTDPTVIYGLGENYTGNLTRRHLRQQTPYNTYVVKGLPPTPIAMPGRQAIHAALNPADGESLFFVAKGDGSHHFSATLSEHNKAVRKYQIRQREQNYRSMPATHSEPATNMEVTQ